MKKNIITADDVEFITDDTLHDDWGVCLKNTMKMVVIHRCHWMMLN